MRRFVFLPLVCANLAAQTTLPPPAAIQVNFDQHIKPILAAKCYSCHGPKAQQSGLRLDKRQNALRGGDYGPVIIAGNSRDSKLIHRVVSGDGGMQMPPTGALDTEEIAILRAWIDQGADFGRVQIQPEAAEAPIDPKVREFISAVRSRDTRSMLTLMKSDRALARSRDAKGSTALHHAAGFGSLATMSLLLDSGADPNARNDRGSTPLHWAITSEAKVRLLLKRGAGIEAKQAEGRTPLHQAASLADGSAVVRLLLEKGANPNLATANGATALMLAAGRGDVETMRLLIARKADVGARSGTGAVALIGAAASGNPEAVRLLLDNGADPNAATKLKLTPLSSAATRGSEASVRLLLEAGANVHIQDGRGYSPLMYAAYAETMPAGIVRTLLAKGVDPRLTGEGETALSLAAKRGDTEVARLLDVPEEQRRRGGVAATPSGPREDRSPAEAVRQALELLERQSNNFIRVSGCNSCHNQFLPSAAAALARERGIAAPSAIAMVSREMQEFTAERTMDMNVFGVNSLGYFMFELGMNRAPKDEYTDAVAHYMQGMQTRDGIWITTGSRPPMTSDDFQTTAFAIYTLRHFAPAAAEAETAKALARAAAFLEKATPATTQERAFHLLGLAWSNSGAAVGQAASRLAATQRPDGGWSQLPGMGSDAYATGEALFALNVAGRMPVTSPTYQKGVRYLLSTQAVDGSWHVKARSLWIQPYFESSFPYGHDQWISAAGTSWACMALALTVEPPRISRR